jgi:hypothetical protein
MFLLISQKGKYIQITKYKLGRQQKQANCVDADCVEGPATTGEGEERRVTPSHSQVLCDLIYQGPCDLRQ